MFALSDINHASRNRPEDQQRGYSVALKNGERRHVREDEPEAGIIREWLKARAGE